MSRAQELIDEALSTPDNTLESLIALSPDSLGKSTSAVSTAPAVSGNASETSPLSRSTVSSRHPKRHPSSSSADSHNVPSIATTSSTTPSVSDSGAKFLKRPITSSKEVTKGQSTMSGLATTSESYTNVVSRSNSWATSSSSFASVAAATSLSSLPPSHASLPVSLNLTVHTTPSLYVDARSQPLSGKSHNLASTSPIPLPEEVDRGGGARGPLSPTVVRSSSRVAAGTQSSSEVIDMNAEFPPLSMVVSTNHHQKQSDVSVPSEAPLVKEETQEPSGLNEEEDQEEVSAEPLEEPDQSSPHLEVDSSKDKDVSSVSEVATTGESAPAKVAPSSEKVTSEVLVGVSDSRKDLATVAESDPEEPAVSSTPPVVTKDVTETVEAATPSLAVGTRPFKSTMPVTSTVQVI